jgi:thiol-disulfide isomerase/thioredoxin
MFWPSEAGDGGALDMNAHSSKLTPRSWALSAAGWLALLGAAAFLYVVFAATSKPPAQGYERFAEGPLSRLEVLDDPPPQPPHPFTGPDGRSTSLPQMRGEILIVNYWATFCAPCRVEMPTLAALQERFGDQVRVAAISIDEGTEADEARAMLAALTDGRLAFHHDISRWTHLDSRSGWLPLTIIYDRDGAELARLAGDADWSSPEAERLIRAVVADHPPL